MWKCDRSTGRHIIINFNSLVQKDIPIASDLYFFFICNSLTTSISNMSVLLWSILLLLELFEETTLWRAEWFGSIDGDSSATVLCMLAWKKYFSACGDRWLREQITYDNIIWEGNLDTNPFFFTCGNPHGFHWGLRSRGVLELNQLKPPVCHSAPQMGGYPRTALLRHPDEAWYKPYTKLCGQSDLVSLNL